MSVLEVPLERMCVSEGLTHIVSGGASRFTQGWIHRSTVLDPRAEVGLSYLQLSKRWKLEQCCVQVPASEEGCS